MIEPTTVEELRAGLWARFSVNGVDIGWRRFSLGTSAAPYGFMTLNGANTVLVAGSQRVETSNKRRIKFTMLMEGATLTEVQYGTAPTNVPLLGEQWVVCTNAESEYYGKYVPVGLNAHFKSIALINSNVSDGHGGTLVYMVVKPTVNGQPTLISVSRGSGSIHDVPNQLVPNSWAYEVRYTGSYDDTNAMIAAILAAYGEEYIIPVTPPQFVDLGLPSGTLWADRNAGATGVEDIGLYISYGNTSGVRKGSSYMFTAETYAETPGAELTSNIVQGGENDAAHVIIGDGAIMPNANQFTELLENTDRSDETINGKDYFKLTSKVNSNYILVPKAGLANRNAYIWDTSACLALVNFVDTDNCQIGRIFGSTPSARSVERYYGANVRAVKAGS